MTDRYILDNDGSPVAEPDLFKWAKWFTIVDNHIASDRFGDVHVSTVFLGLDHSFGNGPPVLFETMIFGGARDNDQWRYRTKQEALEGHAAALALVRGLK